MSSNDCNQEREELSCIENKLFSRAYKELSYSSIVMVFKLVKLITLRAWHIRVCISNVINFVCLNNITHDL